MRLEAPWLIYHSHPNEGHAFLRGSVSPSSLRNEVRNTLADFTDRSPRYGDGQAAWTPYTSGCPLDEFYVVTSTRPDTTARRPGSIVTQALLFPRTGLAASADLGSALRAASGRLPEEGHLWVDLADVPPQVGDAGRTVIAAFVMAAGQAVAVIGEEGWDAAVTETWAALWPEARAQLHFRAFKAPHDLVGNPDLLLVPAPGRAWTVPAWAGGVVRSPFTRESEPPVLGALRDPTGPLAGQVMGSVRDLRRLNVLSAALRDVEQGVWEAAYALTILAHAPLLPEARSTLATDLARRVGGALADQNAAVVNLVGEVPAELATPLVAPVASWFNQAFRIRPEEARHVAEGTGTSGAQTWLAESLRTGLARLQPSEEGARILWSWWSNETLRALTLPALRSEWDHVLAGAVPAGVTSSPLHQEALAHRWSRLYGVLSARMNDLDALVDLKGDVHVAALEGARAELTPGSFLAWAARHSSEDILEAAAHSLRADPVVLRDAPISDGSWLAIWARALPTLAAPDPAGRRGDVLDLVFRGKPVPDFLLRGLAQDGGGNLLAHPQRDTLLTLLPTMYSEQTADAYLQSQNDPGQVEGVLLAAVRTRLQRVAPSPMAARRLLSTPGLSKTDLMVVERPAAQALTDNDLPLVEHLPLETGRRLLGWAPSKVRWAFRHLLAPLEVVQLAADLGRTVESHLWWTALEEFAATMTSAQIMWDRLKAPTTDFPVNSSTREQWQHATWELQQGRGPDVWDVLQRLEESRPAANIIMQALKTTCPEVRKRR